MTSGDKIEEIAFIIKARGIIRAFLIPPVFKDDPRAMHKYAMIRQQLYTLQKLKYIL